MQLHSIGRRTFIKQSAAAIGFLMVPFPKPAQKLCFSTLGCPDWDLPTILQFGKEHGYRGIEFRGIGPEMFLPQSPYFSKEKTAVTKRMIKDSGLEVVSLGSSAQLHHPEGPEAEKHLDEAKKYIELANTLDCPYVRVFPEKLPTSAERQRTIDLIAARLAMLGSYAKERKVTVLVESHGDLVHMSDLKYVLSNAGPNTGMIWDVVNMWVVTKEAPADVFRTLQPYIKHVHLKDLVLDGDKIHYVPFGKGIAPVKEAINMLTKAKYKGYYSFEWEKRWHPEIEAPETALAQYPEAIRPYFVKQ